MTLSCCKQWGCVQLLTVVPNFCLYDAKGRMHFCCVWSCCILVTISWFWNDKPSALWWLRNVKRVFIQTGHTFMSSSLTGHPNYWFDHPVQKFFSKQFLDVWHSSLQIQLRNLFLHKFKHFPDVRRSKTFYCSWSGLTVVLCSPLQSLPPLFTGSQGHGPEGFLEKDSVTVELKHFGAGVTI